MSVGKLGKVIEEKRKELGLTQTQIADELGITTPAVHKWEKGQSYPDVATLVPLARLLKIDMNELFSFYSDISDQEIGEMPVEFAGKSAVDAADGETRKDIVVQIDQCVTECQKIWENIPCSVIDEYWNRATHLYQADLYDKAAERVERLILFEVLKLETHLAFLKRTLTLSGSGEMAKTALDMRNKLVDLFGIRKGMTVFQDIPDGMENEDYNQVLEVIETIIAAKEDLQKINTSPLFREIKWDENNKSLSGAIEEIEKVLLELRESLNEIT